MALTKTTTGGLNFTYPAKGRANFSALFDVLWAKISAHNHEGGGNGLQLAGAALQNASISGVKIKLLNDEFMTGTDFAGTGTINILKVNVSDAIELGAAMTMLHDTYLTAKDNAGTGLVDLIKANTSDELQAGALLRSAFDIITAANIQGLDITATGNIQGVNITATGDFLAGSDNAVDLGSSSNALKDIFMQGDLTFDNDNGWTQNHYTWVPLEKGVASSSTSIDLAIPSGFDEYKIKFSQCRPVNDGVYPTLRLSDDAGVSFKSGASDYTWVDRDQDGGGTVTASEDNTANAIFMADSLSGFSQGNLVDELLDGEAMIYGALNAASKTNIRFFNVHGYTLASLVYSHGAGRYNTNAATDYIRFKYSGGNILSGTVTIYGKKNI